MVGFVLIVLMVAVAVMINNSRSYSERHPDRAAILRGMREKYGLTEEYFKERHLMGRNDSLD